MSALPLSSVQRYPGREYAVNNVMGCLAPEKCGDDKRAKRRTVVLVIVLVFYGWLTTATQLTPLEAAGMLLMIGVTAGVIIDRVLNGSRAATDLALLRQVIDGTTGRP